MKDEKFDKKEKKSRKSKKDKKAKKLKKRKNYASDHDTEEEGKTFLNSFTSNS